MKVALKKIIFADYVTLLTILVPFTFLLLYLDATYFGILNAYIASRRNSSPANPTFFLQLALITLTICLPIGIYRVKQIVNHFKDGHEIKGNITSIFFHKDRGRIEYEYIYEGKKYRSGNAIHANRFVKSLKVGQEVSLILAKENPKKALIKEMYT